MSFQMFTTVGLLLTDTKVIQKVSMYKWTPHTLPFHPQKDSKENEWVYQTLNYC